MDLKQFTTVEELASPIKTLIASTIDVPVYTDARLTASASATDTTITVNRIPSGGIAKGYWVVIDPWTTECEIRKVTGISDTTLTIAALTYGHSTDDGVIFVTEPKANVKWFGALGDGSTDDSTAIQRAIDTIETSGGIVYLPQNTYYLGTSDPELTIDASHVTLTGDGQGETILTYGGSGKAIYLDGSSAAIGNIILKDFTLRATAAGTGPLISADTIDSTTSNIGYIFTAERVELDGGTNNVNVGMRLQDVQNASLQGVSFFDFDTDSTDISLIIDADSLNRGNITLMDCIFSRVQIGVDINPTGSALLNNINFWNVKFVNTSEPASSIGIKIPANVEAIPIHGCHFEHVETGVDITGGKAVDIRGSLFGNVTTGVDINQNTRAVCVQGNRFASVTNAVDIGATNNYYGVLGPNHFGASVTNRYNGVANANYFIVNEQDGAMWLVDGVSAPSATVGFAKMFIDSNDGDLKIIFGDGTTKTISADT